MDVKHPTPRHHGSDRRIGTRRLLTAAVAAVTLAAPVVVASTAGAETVAANGSSSLVAAEGPNHSLSFWWQGSAGGTFNREQVARPNTTYSAPAMVFTDNKAIIAVEGPNHSLDAYWEAIGKATWHKQVVAGAGTTYIAPSITGISPPGGGTGGVDIVGWGPSNSLDFYYQINGAPAWHAEQVAGAQTTFGRPSVTQVDDSTVIATEGTSNSLDFYWQTLGTQPWHREVVAGAGTTFTAPTIAAVVPGEGKQDQADIVTEGPHNTLTSFTQTEGQRSWEHQQVGVLASTYSSPSVVQVGGSMVASAIGPNNGLDFYWKPIGGTGWNPESVNGAGTTFSAPTMAFTNPGGGASAGVEVLAQGVSNSLDLYTQAIGQPTFDEEIVAGSGQAFA